ncbi:hypothetical protein FSARC_3454 [Fusarium sarcochroum]|uniref:Uncharacterized protein n=1 Tax=Fusarium sarcochroum TaxID=1208366 RepID=A0A8H4U480_9HYPO|nr:hypothetical protein FSARC_3454 [Fusarium sarcochroum]
MSAQQIPPPATPERALESQIPTMGNAIEEENLFLRRENESLRQENHSLRQDNQSLRTEAQKLRSKDAAERVATGRPRDLNEAIEHREILPLDGAITNGSGGFVGNFLDTTSSSFDTLDATEARRKIIAIMREKWPDQMLLYGHDIRVYDHERGIWHSI